MIDGYEVSTFERVCNYSYIAIGEVNIIAYVFRDYP